MLKSEIDKMTLCPVYQAGKSYYIEINEELYYFQTSGIRKNIISIQISGV